MKVDLTDLTFIIPIRIDSIIRIENLLMVTDFLLKHFDCNIHVLEAGNYKNEILKCLLDKTIKYEFIEDKDPIFFRTMYLNIMTKKTNTPFIAIWDTDVIIDHKQIIDSIEQLRLQETKVAYPFDGHFYDTSMIIRELYFKTRDINILKKHKGKMNLIYGDDSKGGAIIVNRKAYIKSGMEDENFYGWGSEDFERYERWKVLKYKIYRAKGCLFHLTHGRGLNSFHANINQQIHTNNMVKNRCISSYDEIMRDIESGKLISRK